MNAEDTYIDLYTEFSSYAEYMQADSRVRNLLPEAMIIAGLGFALKALAEPFLKEIGTTAGKAVGERVKTLFSKAAENGDRTSLIEGISALGPQLSAIAAGAPAETEARRAVAAMLETKGFPPDSAEEAASRVVAAVLKGTAEKA